MILAALLWLSLSWSASADPTVIGFRLFYEMHYRFDVACPDEFDPERMCPVYTTGASVTKYVAASACVNACCIEPTYDSPEPRRGEALWFQLAAYRASGCEGPTAFPPIIRGSAPCTP